MFDLGQVQSPRYKGVYSPLGYEVHSYPDLDLRGQGRNARGPRDDDGGINPTTAKAQLVAQLGGGWWDKRTGVTIGTGVSAWVDRVAGKPISQATASKQPAFNTTTGVSPDGVDDSLSGLCSFMDGAPGITIIVCGQMPFGAISRKVSVGTLAGGTAQIMNSGTTWDMRADTSAIQQDWTAGDVGSALAVYMGQFQWSDGATGVKPTQTNAATNGGSRSGGSIAAGSFAVSSLVVVGAYIDGSLAGACSIRQLTVIPSQISQANINLIYTYDRAIEGF